jgi:hypothetical protein
MKKQITINKVQIENICLMTMEFLNVFDVSHMIKALPQQQAWHPHR